MIVLSLFGRCIQAILLVDDWWVDGTPFFPILLPPISVFVGCDKVVLHGGYACVDEYTEEKLLMHNMNAIGSPNIIFNV